MSSPLGSTGAPGSTSSTSGRLAKSAGLVGLATLSSRVLGLVRDVVQGIYFGTSDAADAFAVATRLPQLLRDLFAEGAMSAAFVPTVTRYLKQQGRDAAWRLGSQVINGLFVVTGVLVILGIVFARPLTAYYGEGFADTPAKFAMTVSLTRVNMPFLLLVAIAAAFMGMLNAVRRFFLPASAPAVYNLVFIISMIVFVPVLRSTGLDTVMALSVGMLLGGLAQVAVQWPALRAEGYRHSWSLDPRDPGLREVLILMGPGTLGAAAAQINLLVNTWLSTHTDGAPTALGYAFRMMYMPIGIVGVSIATAAVPDLARHAAAGAHDAMRATVSWGLRLMLMLSVPATVGLMVLARPIVRLIFEHGQFDAASTSMVAPAILFYAPGIVGYSVVKLASPAFYSLQDARTPVIVSVISIVTNLGLNLWLNSVMGFTGLALGTAIAANVNAGLLLIFLSRRIGGIDGGRVLPVFLKIAIASALMGAAVYGADLWLSTGLPRAILGSVTLSGLVRVSAGVAIGVGTIAAAAWVLHIHEFRQAFARVSARLSARSTREQ